MPSKHESISNILIEEILDGRYRSGERLPSERDLSQRFDANRGAVREAMKRLEQIGLASIGPGGARTNPIEMASLDVVGYLMARGDAPDVQLIEQILSVVMALVTTAAESAVKVANDDQLQQLRALIQPLISEPVHGEAHSEARLALMHGFMTIGGSLVVQIISRSLLEQFRPRMESIWPYARDEVDAQAYVTYARQLDQALLKRDLPAVRATLDALNELTRDSVMRALVRAENIQAVSAS